MVVALLLLFVVDVRSTVDEMRDPLERPLRVSPLAAAAATGELAPLRGLLLSLLLLLALLDPAGERGANAGGDLLVLIICIRF